MQGTSPFCDDDVHVSKDTVVWLEHEKAIKIMLW